MRRNSGREGPNWAPVFLLSINPVIASSHPEPRYWSIQALDVYTRQMELSSASGQDLLFILWLLAFSMS